MTYARIVVIERLCQNLAGREDSCRWSEDTSTWQKRDTELLQLFVYGLANRHLVGYTQARAQPAEMCDCPPCCKSERSAMTQNHDGLPKHSFSALAQ